MNKLWDFQKWSHNCSSSRSLVDRALFKIPEFSSFAICAGSLKRDPFSKESRDCLHVEKVVRLAAVLVPNENGQFLLFSKRQWKVKVSSI